jgi:NAD(P)H:quinone oxidoreductase type IV
MSKVLVLYYSSYGHIEAMANAVAEGARQAGAHVDIKRVPELVPEEIARKSHYKFDQVAPIAKVDDLAAYDAIIIGAGTRFGRLPSQMANFLDQAGGLWARGALHGKVGGAFYLERHATWRAGDDAVLDHHQSSALRHGGCGTRLRPCRTDDTRRDYRRLALRCHDDHRRRWLATAHRERARGSPLPGPQDCGDRKQAARQMAFAWETGVTRFSRPPPRSRELSGISPPQQKSYSSPAPIPRTGDRRRAQCEPGAGV